MKENAWPLMKMGSRRCLWTYWMLIRQQGLWLMIEYQALQSRRNPWLDAKQQAPQHSPCFELKVFLRCAPSSLASAILCGESYELNVRRWVGFDRLLEQSESYACFLCVSLTLQSQKHRFQSLQLGQLVICISWLVQVHKEWGKNWRRRQWPSWWWTTS